MVTWPTRRELKAMSPEQRDAVLEQLSKESADRYGGRGGSTTQWAQSIGKFTEMYSGVWEIIDWREGGRAVIAALLLAVIFLEFIFCLYLARQYGLYVPPPWEWR